MLDIQSYVNELVDGACEAAVSLAQTGAAVKNAALGRMADEADDEDDDSLESLVERKNRGEPAAKKHEIGTV